MKINTEPRGFTPVTFTITLENKSELDAMTSLFLHADVRGATTCPGWVTMCDDISDDLEAAGGQYTFCQAFYDSFE